MVSGVVRGVLCRCLSSSSSGSCAAAAGGVTSFLDMPNNAPPVINRERMAEKKQLAAEKSVVNYGFFMGATPDNLEELNAVENVCGIKIFMGSSTGNMLVDNFNTLNNIFSKCEGLIATHCEDEQTIRNNIASAKKKFGDDIPFSEHPIIRSFSKSKKGLTW